MLRSRRQDDNQIGVSQDAFRTIATATGGLYLATHSTFVTIIGTAAASLITGWTLWLSRNEASYALETHTPDHRYRSMDRQLRVSLQHGRAIARRGNLMADGRTEYLNDPTGACCSSAPATPDSGRSQWANRRSVRLYPSAPIARPGRKPASSLGSAARSASSPTPATSPLSLHG
jgi:hypothetical protein